MKLQPTAGRGDHPHRAEVDVVAGQRDHGDADAADDGGERDGERAVHARVKPVRRSSIGVSMNNAAARAATAIMAPRRSVVSAHRPT